METPKTQSRIIVRYRIPPDSEFFEGEVRSFTPLGISIKRTSNTESQLSARSPVEFEVTQSGETHNYQGLIIYSESSPDDIFTARFVAHPETGDERRKSDRWICPNNFLPVAMCPAPGQFNEFIQFQVRNFSSGGLELSTGVTNKFLVRGMMLRLIITLPFTGEASVLVKIARITVSSEQGTEILSLGTSIVDIDQTAQDLIAQYLLQFSSLSTIGEFKTPNKDSSTPPRLKISNVNRAEEYTQVIDCQESLSENWLSLDSRLMLVRLDDSLLAWVTVRFPNHENPLTINTGTLVRPDQVIEVSSIRCLRPELSELILVFVLRYLASVCLSSQRTFIAIEHPPEHKYLLEQCGFSTLQESSIGHPIESLTKPKVSLVKWNVVWAESAESLLSSKSVKLMGISSRLYKIFSLFRSISNMLFSLSISMTISRRDDNKRN